MCEKEEFFIATKRVKSNNSTSAQVQSADLTKKNFAFGG
jgi:hypothetical protein